MKMHKSHYFFRGDPQRQKYFLAFHQMYPDAASLAFGTPVFGVDVMARAGRGPHIEWRFGRSTRFMFDRFVVR